jgi:hypothetical protein
MPLPIPVGIAIGLGTAAIGATKAIEAQQLFRLAREVGQGAYQSYRYAKDDFNHQKTLTQHMLAQLGRQKLAIRATTITEFLQVYERFQQISFTEKNLGVGTLPNRLTPAELDTMKTVSLKATDLLKSGATSLTTGYLATVGATGLATMLGVASTGTALSTLSGAAYTNALLAWFGGGAIAAGGGGIAVGTIILGGIAIGPALAVGGFWLATQAEKALTEAMQYEARVAVQIKNLEKAKIVLFGINERVKEISLVLGELNRRLQQLIQALDMIPNDGINGLTEEHQKTLYISVKFAFVLGQLLECPVFDHAGNVSTQSRNTLRQALTIV